MRKKLLWAGRSIGRILFAAVLGIEGFLVGLTSPLASTKQLLGGLLLMVAVLVLDNTDPDR